MGPGLVAPGPMGPSAPGQPGSISPEPNGCWDVLMDSPPLPGRCCLFMAPCCVIYVSLKHLYVMTAVGRIDVIPK